MRVALRRVERRWAIAMVVRPEISFCSASWISFSVSVSSAEVASSRMRIYGSSNSARAMAMRWRSPPESVPPFSPICVS